MIDLLIQWYCTFSIHSLQFGGAKKKINFFSSTISICFETKEKKNSKPNTILLMNAFKGYTNTTIYLESLSENRECILNHKKRQQSTTDGQIAKLGQTNEINLRIFLILFQSFRSSRTSNRFIFVCFVYYIVLFLWFSVYIVGCVDEEKLKQFRVNFITTLQSCCDPIYVMRLTACSTITAYTTYLSVTVCIQQLRPLNTK